jgi:hypothetical protein
MPQSGSDRPEPRQGGSCRVSRLMRPVSPAHEPWKSPSNHAIFARSLGGQSHYGETPMQPPLKTDHFSAKISPSVRLQTTIHTLQRENLTLNETETLPASGAPSETTQLVRRGAWCILPRCPHLRYLPRSTNLPRQRHTVPGSWPPASGSQASSSPQIAGRWRRDLTHHETFPQIWLLGGPWGCHLMMCRATPLAHYSYNQQVAERGLSQSQSHT